MLNKTRARWTNKAIETLKTMRLAGKTANEIADALGPDFNKRSVSDKARHLNLPAAVVDQWPDSRVEDLKRLILEGLSAAKIASALGVTRNAVIGKVNRLDLKFARKRGRVQATGAPKPRKVKAQPRRVTLPALPINRPDIVVDAKALKAEAFVPLPDAPAPIQMIDLGDMGRVGRPGKCRWPIGENPTLFCGCATESAYCTTHHAMAYAPIEKDDR